jgi:5-(carboxyamino)imidazole ribonucleotide mutase
MGNTSTVGIILGSKSDLNIAHTAIEILTHFNINFDFIISSAHRSPGRTINWVKSVEEKGINVIIAIAGAAAHLAGFVAAHTILPVIAVPVPSSELSGIDSLLSCVQMPGGVPVATMAIGEAGAKNAAILACQILSTANDKLKEELKKYKLSLADKVEKDHNEAVISLKKK